MHYPKHFWLVLLTSALEGFARTDIAGLPVAQMGWVCVSVHVCTEGSWSAEWIVKEKKKEFKYTICCSGCLSLKKKTNNQSAEVWKKISRASRHVQDQLTHIESWIQRRWLKRLLLSACSPHLSQSLLLSEAGHDRTTDQVVPQLPQVTTYHINLIQRNCSQQRLCS